MRRVVLGLLFGGFVGVLVVWVSGLVAKIRDDEDPDGKTFLAALADVRTECTGVLDRFRGRGVS